MRAAQARRGRVLHVVLSLRPGGTERLVVELVRRSRDRVVSAVCCLDEEGEWGTRLRLEGTRVEALGRLPGFRPSLGLQIARLASEHGADVIHCHQYSPYVYGCVSRLGYRHADLLFTEHGRLSDAPRSRKRLIANALLSRLPDRVFTVSDDLRRHLVSEGFRRSQVEVIYNGVDPGTPPAPGDKREARARLGLAPDMVVVGTIARLDPVKDLGTLIAAIALAPAPAAPMLLVIGDGPEREALDRIANEGRAGGRVRFLGHRDDARALLPACDIFANSSTFEGVSLTILEAMAAGLPVVATAVGGTPEIVTADTGILVPARNSGALAEAVVSLTGDSSRRAIMGAAGRRAVEERFTLDRMLDQYFRIYLGEA